jgi:hypothetical protein
VLAGSGLEMNVVVKKGPKALSLFTTRKHGSLDLWAILFFFFHLHRSEYYSLPVARSLCLLLQLLIGAYFQSIRAGYVQVIFYV